MKTSAPTLTVHKFGGAALADAAAIQGVTAIIAGYHSAEKVIVASAMFGVTDALLGLARQAAANEEVRTTIDALRQRHLTALSSIGVNTDDAGSPEEPINEVFEQIGGACAEIAARGELTPMATDTLISHGDR